MPPPIDSLLDLLPESTVDSETETDLSIGYQEDDAGKAGLNLQSDLSVSGYSVVEQCKVQFLEKASESIGEAQTDLQCSEPVPTGEDIPPVHISTYEVCGNLDVNLSDSILEAESISNIPPLSFITSCVLEVDNNTAEEVDSLSHISTDALYGLDIYDRLHCPLDQGNESLSTEEKTLFVQLDSDSFNDDTCAASDAGSASKLYVDIYDLSDMPDEKLRCFTSEERISDLLSDSADFCRDQHVPERGLKSNDVESICDDVEDLGERKNNVVVVAVGRDTVSKEGEALCVKDLSEPELEENHPDSIAASGDLLTECTTDCDVRGKGEPKRSPGEEVSRSVQDLEEVPSMSSDSNPDQDYALGSCEVVNKRTVISTKNSFKNHHPEAHDKAVEAVNCSTFDKEPSTFLQVSGHKHATEGLEKAFHAVDLSTVRDRFGLSRNHMSRVAETQNDHFAPVSEQLDFSSSSECRTSFIFQPLDRSSCPNGQGCEQKPHYDALTKYKQKHESHSEAVSCGITGNQERGSCEGHEKTGPKQQQNTKILHESLNKQDETDGGEIESYMIDHQSVDSSVKKYLITPSENETHTGVLITDDAMHEHVSTVNRMEFPRSIDFKIGSEVSKSVLNPTADTQSLFQSNDCLNDAISLALTNSIQPIRKPTAFSTNFVIDSRGSSDEPLDITWAYTSLAYPYRSCVEIRQVSMIQGQYFSGITENRFVKDHRAIDVGTVKSDDEVPGKLVTVQVENRETEKPEEISNYAYVLPPIKGIDSISESKAGESSKRVSFDYQNQANDSNSSGTNRGKLRRSTKFLKSDSRIKRMYRKYSLDSALEDTENSGTDDGYSDSSEGGIRQRSISNCDFLTLKSEKERDCSNGIPTEYFMPLEGGEKLAPFEVSVDETSEQVVTYEDSTCISTTTLRASFKGFCETMLGTSSPTEIPDLAPASPKSCDRKSLRKTLSNDYSVDSGITGSDLSAGSDASPTPSRSFSPSRRSYSPDEREALEAVYQLDRALTDIEHGESSDATLTESNSNLSQYDEKSNSFKYRKPPQFEAPPPPPFSRSLCDLFDSALYRDTFGESTGYRIPRPKLAQPIENRGLEIKSLANAHGAIEGNNLVEELLVQVPAAANACLCNSCEANRNVQDYIQSCRLYEQKKFNSLPAPPKPARSYSDMPQVRRDSMVTIECGTVEENGVRLIKYVDYSKQEGPTSLTGTVTGIEMHPDIGTPKSVRFSASSKPTKPSDRKKKNSERRKTCAIDVSELRSLDLEKPRPVSVAFDGNTAIYRRDSTLSAVRIEEVSDTSSTIREGSVDLDAGGVVARPDIFEPSVVMPAEQCCQHFVIVAIDFGTTFSGYAFSFVKDPENIHLMRKWEGGDPGLSNQKTPTVLLLTPDGEFHSFGYTARDFYHDLEPREARRWLYFDKFKMTLHHEKNLTRETTITATNGQTMPALTVFAHALRHFRDHAVRELSDHSGTKLLDEDIRWVITVPAIWRPQAKQFMREAAYEAGLANPSHPNHILIALEPEAASIYCRQLKLNQLVPEKPPVLHLTPPPESPMPYRPWQNRREHDSVSVCSLPAMDSHVGTRYMVVDCGGGTVDITVHEVSTESGLLKELHRATGGPCGAVGVDSSFERLLGNIFGEDFMCQFKTRRPASHVDLLIAFEARKRNASPFKCTPLNVALPFSFIDAFRKFRGKEVETAIRKYNDPHIRWSSQGMLRLDQEAMRRLFEPTLTAIVEHIDAVLRDSCASGITHLFLVGGFAESALLQHKVREAFGDRLKVIVPQYASLVTLRGAVCFGLNPGAVAVRRSRLTIGVGVLNKFIPGIHPIEKLIRRDNESWCTDVFDKFVLSDQSVALGDRVVRSYTPARANQPIVILHVYCSDSDDPKYVTDPGVRRLAALRMELTPLPNESSDAEKTREIRVMLEFGHTEVRASALEVVSGKSVDVKMDFLESMA